jgi:hypothetical protein
VIYVKLVAVCDTSGCETTQDYVVEINLEEELPTIPEGWEWVYDVPMRGGMGRRLACPLCMKERKK